MSRKCRSFLLSLIFLAVPALADQQDDLLKLRKRIDELQQEFEKTSESKSETADLLRASERAISDSNRKLHQLIQRQQSAQRTLSQLQRQTAQLQQKISTQQSGLGKLFYQQYLNGNQYDYLKLLLNNRDPNQAARDLHYYGYLAKERSVAIRELRSDLQHLRTIAKKAKQQRDDIDAMQQDERAQKLVLEKEQRSRQQVLQRTAASLKNQQREIGRLQHNEARLSLLVNKLSHVIPGKPSPALFKSLRGKLPVPVAAKPSNRFGSRRPESTLLWTGWFLRARPGLPVKAIAAGRVIYADWLRGFGNLLIIDHGQGYMSLYGNNEALLKQVGEELSAGETIATVGNSGGIIDSGLYFELRFEGKAFDPMPWVKGLR